MNQLADFADVGRASVSELLNGKRTPTLRTIVKLAAALEVDAADLLASS